MKPATSVIVFLISVCCVITGAETSQAQTLPYQAISVGGVLGDPSGATISFPFGTTRALDLGIGPDYFGSPRLQVDWVWVFHFAGSRVVSEYAGPGLAVAFAKGINSFYTREPRRESFASAEDNRFDVGGRAIFGIDIAPRKSRLVFFVESGPLLPAGRVLDIDVDGAIGVRYRL